MDNHKKIDWRRFDDNYSPFLEPYSVPAKKRWERVPKDRPKPYVFKPKLEIVKLTTTKRQGIKMALKSNTVVITHGRKAGNVYKNDDPIVIKLYNGYTTDDESKNVYSVTSMDGSELKVYDRCSPTDPLSKLCICQYDGKFRFRHECEWLGSILVHTTNKQYYIACYGHPELGTMYFKNQQEAELAGFKYSQWRGKLFYYKNENFYPDKTLPLRYHAASRHHLHDEANRTLIGVEIEKFDIAHRLMDISTSDIYYESQWFKERDSSLHDPKNPDTPAYYGFELVSPTYCLYKDDIFQHIKKYPYLQKMIEMKYNESCGGHIHFSKIKKRDSLGETTQYTPDELYDRVSGYMPLLYALYESRLDKHHCKAKSSDDMKANRGEREAKYQAVRFLKTRIEFRIFPAVKSVENLRWRIELLRIMDRNPHKFPEPIAQGMIKKGTALYEHLRKIYSHEQILGKAVLMLQYADKYENLNYNAMISEINGGVIKPVMEADEVG